MLSGRQKTVLTFLKGLYLILSSVESEEVTLRRGHFLTGNQPDCATAADKTPVHQGNLCQCTKTVYLVRESIIPVGLSIRGLELNQSWKYGWMRRSVRTFETFTPVERAYPNVNPSQSVR